MIFTRVTNGQSIDAATFNNPMVELESAIEASTVHIETRTLAASATGVMFTSIPTTFRDLILIIRERPSVSVDHLFLRINGDAGTNYWSHSFKSSVAGGAEFFADNTGQYYIRNSRVTYTEPADIFNNMTIQIFDYQNTAVFSTIRHFAVRPSSTLNSNAVLMGGGYWASTAAITQLYLNANIAADSSVSLFGRGDGV